MMIGKGAQPRRNQKKPYRILDDISVYHISENPFNLSYKNASDKKLIKWGEFYHPFMMFGMPDIGGNNKLYVDTRIKDWYVLVLVSKLDEWMNGPSYSVYNILAWTPKQKNDNIVKAGYRMFWASAMVMENVEEKEFYNDGYENESEWNSDWHCSNRCFEVLAAIRKTSYESETDFQSRIKSSPPMLHPHMIKNKVID
jgi:hypothetical protein